MIVFLCTGMCRTDMRIGMSYQFGVGMKIDEKFICIHLNIAQQIQV